MARKRTKNMLVEPPITTDTQEMSIPLLPAELEAFRFINGALECIGVIEPTATLKQISVLVLKIICQRTGAPIHNAQVNANLNTKELIITPR